MISNGTWILRLIWLWVQNAVPGGVVGALILLVVGWLIARLLQACVTAALRRTGLDRRLAPALSNDPGATSAPGDTAKAIGRIVFWVVMLFVLVGVFDALGSSSSPPRSRACWLASLPSCPACSRASHPGARLVAGPHCQPDRHQRLVHDGR
jgi:hypothetical protein